MSSGPHVEYMALPELAKRRARSNPKKHDAPGIATLIRRVGFVKPLLLNERTSKLVAGHGRLEALELLFTQEPGNPPARILLREGAWLAPVVRGVSFKSEREAEDFLVADNHLVEEGGWDNGVLSEMLVDLQDKGDELVKLAGWDGEALAGILKESADDHRRAAEGAGGDSGGVIRQIVLWFPAAKFEAAVARIQAAQEKLGTSDHTTTFRKLLEVYEAAHRR